MADAELRLTPQGRLVWDESGQKAGLDAALAARLRDAFGRGPGEGLLQLGAGEIGRGLPPALAWWRGFAGRFIHAICRAPASEPAPPDDAELAALVQTAPIMPGAEYLRPDVLRDLWQALGRVTATAVGAADADLQAVLRQFNPAWNLVGRVYFNLAENRGDPDSPFAFMATYTARLTEQARAQHWPLGHALREYAGDRSQLLALLGPVQRAAEACPWLRSLVDDGDIYHPLRWSPSEAAQLLGSVPALEVAGVILRMPQSWRDGRPARPKATAVVGKRPASGFGVDALLDFTAEITLDGERLTTAEIAGLLAGTAELVLLRGRWVEIDRARLDRTLARFRAAETRAGAEGLSFAEAMRLLSGADLTSAPDAAFAPDWAEVTAGPWLAETLRALRDPASAGADPGPELLGTLRPYQKAGVAWLDLLSRLGLGACLADDMGLGKTLQVLALLLAQRRETTGRKRPGLPSLLVAPASLLANWAAEIARFAPSLRIAIVHPSAMARDARRDFVPAGLDLALTSYGSLQREAALGEAHWRLVILDEAQAIKNAATRQARAVKALKSAARIALTGTPVENGLGDLWSIFDFINPGQLGSASQFRAYVKQLESRPENPFGPLRELVRPFILRRMKTDRAVIADLPDKTEVTAHCHLTRRQAALYTQAVDELAKRLNAAEEGIERRGVVLTMLMRLKQICNHPSHWLGDGGWAEADSGKFARLREIAETVAARQEKMLVFTQFREAVGPIADFLETVFGSAGLTLHGATAVKARQAKVERFQSDERVPFFVLSLKAGGTGLTLTAAAHVVHFDRWWNPAVENQATDRAFRIGQKRNVLVHKFVCRGTFEEKIDALIEAKRGLSEAVLTGGTEVSLTELPDDELLRLVRLNLDTAITA